jgi:hypothetical protein
MSKAQRKDKEVPVAERATRVRPKVPCDCKKCNGKLVDPRTRQKHVAEEDRFQASISVRKGKGKEANPSTQSSSGGGSSSSGGGSQILYDDDVVMDDRSDEEFLTPSPVSFRKKRRRYDRFQEPYVHNIIVPDEGTDHRVDSPGESGDDEDSIYDGPYLDDDELSSDDEGIQFKLFATPGGFYNSDQEDYTTNTTINDPWILLWIFKYQERFRLSDVAINSLIGFISLVLKDVNANRFEHFPSTAYMARKILDIKKGIKIFATCADVTSCIISMK